MIGSFLQFSFICNTPWICPSQVIIFSSVQARRLCHLRYLWQYVLCVVGAITLKDFSQRNESTLLKVVTRWPLFTYHINYSLVVNNNQDMSSYIFEHCPQWTNVWGSFCERQRNPVAFLFDFDSWHHSYWLMESVVIVCSWILFEGCWPRNLWLKGWPGGSYFNYLIILRNFAFKVLGF